MCAGDGRDLLDVLAEKRSTGAVSGRLVELNPVLVERARARAPEGIEVVRADAGLTSAYVSAVPADLLLVCGVFGNVPDAHIERTVRALPSLAAPGAVVIWTRHHRPPDRTVEIRRCFTERTHRHSPASTALSRNMQEAISTQATSWLARYWVSSKRSRPWQVRHPCRLGSRRRARAFRGLCPVGSSSRHGS
jgi:hypothetical protein